MIRPSANSLIAKKPVLPFVVFNGSCALVALVMYLSGTPTNIILFSIVSALVVMNGVLFISRRKATAAPPVGADPAPRSKKRAWLCLVSGACLLTSSLFEIAEPRLPSDRPLGIMVLIGSLAVLFMAWKEFKRPADNP
jgi:hypothetical protein